MANTVRIDKDGFNHGVDEILTLKPIRRSFVRLFYPGKAPSAEHNTVASSGLSVVDMPEPKKPSRKE